MWGKKGKKGMYGENVEGCIEGVADVQPPAPHRHLVV
jgi:hypothetical protein